MNSILQGTTPSLEIKISTDDFLVSDLTALELVFQNSGNISTHGLSDVSLDTEANSLTYRFTEAETLALTPSASLYWQARFGFADGSILGTAKSSIAVSDLISEAVMGG